MAGPAGTVQPVLDRDYPTPTVWTKLRARAIQEGGDLLGAAYDLAKGVGAIGWTSRRAKAFGSFGQGSLICFPLDTLVCNAATYKPATPVPRYTEVGN